MGNRHLQTETRLRHLPTRGSQYRINEQLELSWVHSFKTTHQRAAVGLGLWVGWGQGSGLPVEEGDSDGLEALPNNPTLGPAIPSPAQPTQLSLQAACTAPSP